ncbi:unnamed protein product [Prunus armeniaca]
MNAKATLAEDDISRRSQSDTGSHFAWLAWLCMTKATMSHQGTRMPKTLHLPKPPSDKWSGEIYMALPFGTAGHPGPWISQDLPFNPKIAKMAS